ISGLDGSIDERIGSKVAEMRSQISSEISGLDGSIDERIGSKVTEMRSQMATELSGLDSKIEERVRGEANAVISAMDLEIKNMAWLASILEGRMKGFEDVPLSSDLSDHDGMNYFVFEEAFRGSRETIKERQSAFVRYFEGSKNVLDIGCGRGEFLELLRDAGIGGRGIDINEDMVAYCRSRGLDVERIDAIAYLEGLEDKSLDGVFLDQVVEHLRPDYMVKMLGLCYKKMKYGHYIVVETVNPLSFTSLANFYIDLTHVRPVHPETLRFLLGVMGFREVEARFSSPVSDAARLKNIEARKVTEESAKTVAEVHDNNIDLINNALYGAMDYAIIGKK
ncbi:methionine biosynthesis protein MetW, partial [Methanotrichaceae archaeon M04Ac]